MAHDFTAFYSPLREAQTEWKDAIVCGKQAGVEVANAIIKKS
jgi:hypothetical protein